MRWHFSWHRGTGRTSCRCVVCATSTGCVVRKTAGGSAIEYTRSTGGARGPRTSLLHWRTAYRLCRPAHKKLSRRVATISKRKTARRALAQHADQFRNFLHLAKVADHLDARFEILTGKFRIRRQRAVFALDVGPRYSKHRGASGHIDRTRITPAVPGVDRDDRARLVALEVL